MTKAKNSIALIDGDVLVYHIAYGSQINYYKIDNTYFLDYKAAREAENRLGVKAKKIPTALSENQVEYNFDFKLKEILANTKCKEFRIYLTETGEKNNFRNEIYDQYKKNRKGDKPLHYQTVRNYIAKKYKEKVFISKGEEADDLIGIHNTELKKQGLTPIVCSIDKDMLTLAGVHYNFRFNAFIEIDELEAERNFYKQLLTGDTTDNIPGINGLGPVTATRILEDCEDTHHMFVSAFNTYWLIENNSNNFNNFRLKKTDIENIIAKSKKKEFFNNFRQKMKEFPSDMFSQIVLKKITRNGKLLRIRRFEGEVWSYEI